MAIVNLKYYSKVLNISETTKKRKERKGRRGREIISKSRTVHPLSVSYIGGNIGSNKSQQTSSSEKKVIMFKSIYVHIRG